MLEERTDSTQVLLQVPAPVEKSAGGARPFRNATRHLRGVTSEWEKRVLIWMARRLPASVNSDHLTLLGLVSMFLVGASYAAARWNRNALLLATAFLILNWAGDSLDGTLARVRHRERPRYGFYVDHMLDVFGALFLSCGLAISGYMHPLVALGGLVAFLMLVAEVYLATYTLGVFRMSFAGLGGTEIRLALAAGNLALWLHPMSRVAHTYRLFDFGGCVAVAGMAVMLLVVVPMNVARLYREEKL
jgi:archaetidylinositol phosphate synthase